MIKEQADILIVGGGAAGLIAAGVAGGAGKQVVVIEKMPRLGRKLGITGKGRCNITNIAPLARFLEQVAPNSSFLTPAFQQFFSQELIDLFTQLGIATVTERGGRVFPVSHHAGDIVNGLVNWVYDMPNVRVLKECPVVDIIVENHQVQGVATTHGDLFYGKHVILCTGGKSYPATGSTGDAYEWCSRLGHTITPLYPALVPLVTQEKIDMKQVGLGLKNINLSIEIDGVNRHSLFGDLSFTAFGMTGPLVLTASRLCVDDILSKEKQVVFSIDLKPALTPEQLFARIERELVQRHQDGLISFLRCLLPKEVVFPFINKLRISPGFKAGNLSAEQKQRIVYLLKHFSYTIVDTRPFEEAIVTKGGVALSEVDEQTMASKKVKNLYFAGELLDLDGNTGGYNLQIAFSTGWLAAMSCVNNCA